MRRVVVVNGFEESSPLSLLYGFMISILLLLGKHIQNLATILSHSPEQTYINTTFCRNSLHKLLSVSQAKFLQTVFFVMDDKDEIFCKNVMHFGSKYHTFTSIKRLTNFSEWEGPHF